MMTSTQQFISLAVEGGYKIGNGNVSSKKFFENGDHLSISKTSVILFDPLAWAAVGKVKGWGDDGISMDVFDTSKLPIWKLRWGRSIDLLADGKSIEEALTEILK